MTNIKKVLRFLGVIVGGAVALAGCSGSGTGPVGIFGPEKIVFASRRSGLADIYIMNPDGSAQQQLTDNMIFERSLR